MKTRLGVVGIGMVLVAVASFLGCSGSGSSDVAGGGFETSDLNAQVVDTNGNPISSARVWLLAETGDSAAQALDSLISDSKGLVRFPVRDTSSLGLEAWKGDSLGVVLPQVDWSGASPVRLVLRPSRALVLRCDSFGSHRLLVAGSHFIQTPPSVCTDSFTIIFPPGLQNLLDLAPQGVPPRIIPVLADSLPFWKPHGPPPGAGGPQQNQGPPHATGGP